MFLVGRRYTLSHSRYRSVVGRQYCKHVRQGVLSAGRTAYAYGGMVCRLGAPARKRVRLRRRFELEEEGREVEVEVKNRGVGLGAGK